MKPAVALLVFAAFGVLLPLAGAWLAGRPLAPYLRLSPEAPLPAAASFEWSAFLLYALLIIAVVGPAVWRIAAVRAAPPGPPARRFPWWGWFGFALTLLAWAVAWSRIPGLAWLQSYTFTPLWVGYILVVHALVFRRTGHCLPVDRPGCFLLLFPASAVFWWYFEYIDRYVGNWYYAGLGPIGSLEYFVHASISFSTVLPAVVGTRDWLASFPRLQAAFGRWTCMPVAGTRAIAWVLLALGASGFIALGLWPRSAYAMAWLAPMLALLALEALLTGAGALRDLARGDWRNTALPALAALVAGWFWELWNWRSLAHWEYSIPLVDGLALFEMPILGYAGYLPFGIVCAIVSRLVCGRH